MSYRNILARHKNTDLGLSTIHLVGVDMIEIANSILIIERFFNICHMEVSLKNSVYNTLCCEEINERMPTKTDCSLT